MKFNQFTSKLNYFSTNHLVLIYGILGISLYKVWKYIVSHFFIQDGSSFTYYEEQIFFTLYRMIASLVGIFLLKKFFRTFKDEWFFGEKKYYISNLFIIIPLWFLMHYQVNNFSFRPFHFTGELFFNFFTGTFEEIFFRGLILVGLSQYFAPLKSTIIASALFSIWHYDVTHLAGDFINIFLFGVYAGLCYLNGASLFSLILFHFLWDQVVFGFGWKSISGGSSDLIIQFIDGFLMVFQLKTKYKAV